MNKYFQDIKVTINEDSKNKATFSAEPFERGYGVTIGNGIRRTLLTALPGAAITSLKIDGVSHEFTTIEGVSEDICDIILNLKKVRFKLDDDAASSELINFDIQGPSSFKASDLTGFMDYLDANAIEYIVKQEQNEVGIRFILLFADFPSVELYIEGENVNPKTQDAYKWSIEVKFNFSDSEIGRAHV